MVSGGGPEQLALGPEGHLGQGPSPVLRPSLPRAHAPGTGLFSHWYWILVSYG